jgi:hypothetical protein
VPAASSDDREALSEAVRYPPYELPIDMWRDLPQPTAAPRRLAITEYGGYLFSVPPGPSAVERRLIW